MFYLYYECNIVILYLKEIKESTSIRREYKKEERGRKRKTGEESNPLESG